MFVTVEGIKASGRSLVSFKLGESLERSGYKVAYEEAADPVTQGEALDYIMEISDRVGRLSSKSVIISMFYLDTFFANIGGAKLSDMHNNKGLIDAISKAYKLAVPDISIHLVCDPRVATNKILALNSGDIRVEKNIELCRVWEGLAEEFMANMASLRAIDASVRRELDTSLDSDFMAEQIEMLAGVLLEKERIKDVRKSPSKTRKELRSY